MSIKDNSALQRARYRAKQAASGKPVNIYTVPKRSSSGTGQDQLHPDPVIQTTSQQIIESNLASSNKTSSQNTSTILHTKRTGQPLPSKQPSIIDVSPVKTTTQKPPTYKDIQKNLDSTEKQIRTQGLKYPLQTYVSETLQGKPNTKQISEIKKQRTELKTLENQNYQIRRTSEGYKFYKTPEQIEQELLSSQKQKIRSAYDTPSVHGFLHTWTTGMLSWEDPLSLKSLYYTFKGDREKIIETKARASMDLDAALAKGWPSYTLKAATGPMAAVGTSYVVGAGVGAGVGAVKTVYPLAGKAVQTGLGVYGGVKGVQSVKQAMKQGEEGWVNLGTRLAVTLPSGILGYSKGAQYGALKTSGFMQNRGLKPITYGEVILNKLNPQNLLVKYKAEYKDPSKEFAKSVLEGKTTFSESKSAEASMKLFEKARDPLTQEYRAAHAAPHKWKGAGEISTGSSEHPGLYVTPEGRASPYFLKVDIKNLTPPRYVKFSLLPKIKKPSLVKFNLKSVTRAPENVRYNIGKFNTWLQKQMPGSKAFITAKHEIGAPEIEAVIPAGSRYSPNTTGYGFIQKLKGYRYYTTYQGKAIPIREFKIMDITKGSRVISAARFGSTGKYSYLSRDISYRSYFSPYTSTIGASLVSFSSNRYMPRSSLKGLYSIMKPYSSKANRIISSSYKPTTVSLSTSLVSTSSSKTTSYAASSLSIKTPSITASKTTYRYYPRAKRSNYTIPSMTTYRSTYKPLSIPRMTSTKIDMLTMKKTKIKTNLNKIMPDYRYREFKIPNLSKIIGGNNVL